MEPGERPITLASQLTEEQKQFLALVTPAALDAERRWQIPASITIAQAILESAWGRSRLFRKANNPFGIKWSQARAHHEPAEKYCEFDTRECERGEWKTVVARFAAYNVLADAFRGHARLIWSGPYSPVIAELHGDPATRPQRVAQALQDCGYATDPNYAQKLVEIINQFHLDDPQTLNTFTAKTAEIAENKNQIGSSAPSAVKTPEVS